YSSSTHDHHSFPTRRSSDLVLNTQAFNAAEALKAQAFNAYDRPHRDLREFIARAERAGEIVRIAGADWNLEMGTLAEIVNHGRPDRKSTRLNSSHLVISYAV